MQDITLFIQNHMLLCLALIAVLFVLVIVEFINQKRATKQLSAVQATQLINRSNAAVVDIRAPASYSAGHIIGAISAPLSELKEKIKKLEKFKSQPIVIVCASGIESPRASAILIADGFDVHILAGGIRSWTDADMPLVKD